jgi:hypothetical protein
MTRLQRAPKTLEECRHLLLDPEFENEMRVRLVELAYTTNTTVAVKAIEMLLAAPLPVDDLGLGDVDRLTLEVAEAGADAMLRELQGNDRQRGA